MASAAEQRTAALKSHFAGGGGGLRPIATSLNGDTAWLLSFPQPAAERAASGRLYFHIVVDPWLKGYVLEGSRYILRIELNYTQAFTAPAAIDAYAAEIEEAAAEALGGGGPGSNKTSRPTVDALVSTFGAAEHCVEESFRMFPPETPVFAPADAAKRIRSWKHFATVVTLKSPKPAALGSWRDAHPGAPLPGWLSLIHLNSSTPNYFGLAIIASSSADAGGTYELLMHFPHGLSSKDRLAPEALLHRASPPLTTLAVLHPLNDYILWIGVAVQSGVKDGLRLARESKAKYWLKTADPDSTLTGLAGWFGREIQNSIDVALEKEAKGGVEGVTAEKPNFFSLENGASMVLN